MSDDYILFRIYKNVTRCRLLLTATDTVVRSGEKIAAFGESGGNVDCCEFLRERGHFDLVSFGVHKERSFEFEILEEA